MAADVILCGSKLRPPNRVGPGALIRLASDAGFDGIVIDGGCTLSSLPATIAEAVRAGLTCPALFGPLPEGPLPPGKRLPHLSAWEDKEERYAAVKLVARTIEEARALGVTHFVLELGRVALAETPALVRRAFARVELEEGEPGHRPFRRLLDERKNKADAVLDACRSSLELVLGAAEKADAHVLLIVAKSPWRAPSPRETQALLREFSGAPLGLVAAPGRRAVLKRLGLAGPPERGLGLAPATALVYATDGVGLEDDLLPGLGEIDLAATTPIAPGVPHAVSGRADASPSEVGAARLIASALGARRPDPSAAS